MYAEEFRQWRECCSLTMRDVEQRANWLAELLNDNKYNISRTWLSEVERGHVAPQLHKLCALLIVYRLPLGDFPRLCGIEESHIIKYQLRTPLPATCPFSIYNDELVDGEQRLLQLPRIDPAFNGIESSTEEHIIVGQGAVSLSETVVYDSQDLRYAFIGTHDQRMAPLVPPGAFIRIDTRQREIVNGLGPDELRPLYLVRIGNQYRSCWLESTGRRLTLLAHSLSGSQSLIVRNPRDVEIIGRVTGMVMGLDHNLAREQQKCFTVNHSRVLDPIIAQLVAESRETRLRPLVDLNFLRREIASWGIGPLVLWQHLDHDNWHLGYIGSTDWMAYPRLSPGAWVRIDERNKQVEKGPWPNNYQRPFYFVKVPEGHTCCWVERDGDDLVLVPYPGSPCLHRRLRYGKEAHIVGRVIWAATRLIDDQEQFKSDHDHE